MDYLKKAKKLMPKLYERIVRPLSDTIPKTDDWMRKDGSFTLDFGEHLVGNITLSVIIKSPCGLIPDSPLHIEFKFAENLLEFDEKPYNGNLSSSWFQTEVVHVDNPLEPFELPRRYAFRYVKVTFLANTEYYVAYKDCFVKAVTSADVSKVKQIEINDELLKKIDDVSVKTLKDCMQLVFEDGPKRDRRLWLGDLYLQAKANYVTFKNNDLVKRCLYLFAGLPHESGCLSSAVYYEPILNNQAWILHDYALFFIGTLADYYRETKDKKTLKELWKTAYRQTEIADVLDENGRRDERFYFVDWCDGLDKTCAAEGIFVSMLKEALGLAEICGSEKEKKAISERLEAAEKRLIGYFDESEGLFKGASGQISVQSNMWGILAGVLPKEKARAVLEKLLGRDDVIKTVTPYAMHYLIEAMFLCGMNESAFSKIREYWGGMVNLGADTFWEVYVPDNPDASPYGAVRMNSFCHAWSCTPTYFIRKYY